MESFLKNFLEPLSYFIYAVVFFLKLRKSRSVKEKVLFIYYLGTTLLMLAGSLIVIYTPANVANNWVYNTFYMITIAVLSYYFYQVFNTVIKKNIVAFMVSVNIVFFIIYDVMLKGFYDVFNEPVYGICYLSIVVYALLYFDQLITNVNEFNILSGFDFWLVSSYLLYFLGCFVIVLFYLTLPVNERGPTWAMQNIILFLSSLIILTGYLRIYYRSKTY